MITCSFTCTVVLHTRAKRLEEQTCQRKHENSLSFFSLAFFFFAMYPRGFLTLSFLLLLTCSNGFAGTQRHTKLPPTTKTGHVITSHRLQQFDDYSEAAKLLFSNILVPSSMLLGGLIPFGFLSAPLPMRAPYQARALFMTLSVTSVASEILAIVYATTARNALIRHPPAPATSVMALIRRDYELPYVATMVHSFLGLVGFGGMVMTHALCSYPAPLNIHLCGLAVAAVLIMTSVFNGSVIVAPEEEQTNMISMGVRYVVLSLKSFRERQSVLGMTGTVLFLYCGIRTLHKLLTGS